MTLASFSKGRIKGFFLSQAGKKDTDAAAAKQAGEVAARLAQHIDAAKFNLHLAIYDFRLDAAAAAPVIDALKAKARAGLTIRLAYFMEPHRQSKLAAVSGEEAALAFAHVGGDPAPAGTADFLQQAFAGTDVELKAIDGHGHLMHDKYVIRDAMTPDAAVWTGSANFTNGAWGLQENNVLIVESADLAQYYETDFWELWSTGSISTTGRNDTGAITLDDGTGISVAFSPGEGRAIDIEIAQAIGAASKRLLIASMVISSGTVLGALNDALGRGGLTVAGIFDRTQMQGVMKDFRRSGSPQSLAKAQLFEAIAPHLHAKSSHAYSASNPHDYMHDKLVVVDDMVITGSFNFSNNATNNAENILKIRSPWLADEYAGCVQELIKHYPQKGLGQVADATA
jgi:phosphatidylserine/phosphatidylglycerophosphate/cardiolipin synthase-like enzyme